MIRIPPGLLFLGACFVTGISVAASLHSLLWISPLPSRIGVFSLIAQALIVVVLGILRLLSPFIARITQSDVRSLEYLLGIWGAAFLIGVGLCWV